MVSWIYSDNENDTGLTLGANYFSVPLILGLAVRDSYVLLLTFERTVRPFRSINIFEKRLRIRDARSI